MWISSSMILRKQLFYQRLIRFAVRLRRVALEKLIVDGRIHPARIEEMVEKAQKEVEAQIREDGENAAMDVGVHGIHPELLKLLGRMKFRSSYGQNALKHSIEVAQLSGLLAGEIGVDVRMAKRAGLLHDIGKSIDHEVEGSHIQIGVDLCKKYKESDRSSSIQWRHIMEMLNQSLLLHVLFRQLMQFQQQDQVQEERHLRHIQTV